MKLMYIISNKYACENDDPFFNPAVLAIHGIEISFEVYIF